MKAHANTQSLFKRAMACIAAFTLAFSLFATPAYAAEVADAPEPAETSAAAASVPEMPALPAEEPAAPSVPEVPAYAADTPSNMVTAEETEATSSVAQETTEEEATSLTTTNEGVVEEDTSTEAAEEEDPAVEQPTSEFLCSFTAQGVYDPTTQDITYTITAYNPSENETTYEGIALAGSYWLAEEPEAIELSSSFTLAPGESQTFTTFQHVTFPPSLATLQVLFTYTATYGDVETTGSVLTECQNPTGGEVEDPDAVWYVVNYYLDSLDSEPFDAVTGQGAIGDPILVDTALHQEPGYQPAQVSGAEVLTSDSQNNVVNVLYTRNSYGYTVNYYKDSTEGKLFASERNTGLYGDDIPYDMSTHVPEGYDDFAEVTPVSSYQIGTDAEQNVLNVVYFKKTNIPYTVYYYLDSVDGQQIGVDTKYGTYDDLITISEEELAANVQSCPGYSAASAEISGIERIGADPESNVVQVVYQRGFYGYTVNYYKDAIDPSNLITFDTGSLEYGQSIPYTLGAHVPEGYNPNGAVRGATTVGHDPAQNVLNIIYSRQGGLEYTVNYYLDSTSNRPFYTDSGFGAFGDPIPVEADSHLQLGYASYALEGPETITALSQNNVVNVVYQRGSYGYTVNYYTDAIDPNNLVTFDRGVLEYGQSIPFTMGNHVPNGYDPHGTAYGATVVSYDANSNVLNIVYPRATFEYTVNYYLGSTEGQLVGTRTASGLFGTAIAVDEGAYVQPGFSAIPQVSGASSIGFVPEQNVVNVVYAPAFDSFYASSIAPVNTTYNGQTHYIQPGGVVAGDTITYSYNGTTLTRTVGVDQNIGLGFQEVTEGEVTVSITVTRAGITSNPIQTSVNIAPVVVPPTPENPVDPSVPDTPTDPVTPADPEKPSTPNTPNTPNVPMYPADIEEPAGNVGDAIAAALAGDEVAPAADPASDATPAAEETPEETTIEDDVNPLASNPYTTEGAQQQGNSIILLFSAALFAVAALGLLFMRKRWIASAVPTMDGVALAAEKVKTNKLALSAAILFAAALGSGVLWIIFRI